MAIIAFDDLVLHRGEHSPISETPGAWILPAQNMSDRRPAFVARTDYLDVTELVTLPATHAYSGGFIFALFGLDCSDGDLTINYTLGTSIGSPSNLFVSPDLHWSRSAGVPNRLVHFCTTAHPPRAMYIQVRNSALSAETDIGRLWLSPFRKVPFSRGWESNDDDAAEHFESEGRQVYARGRAVRQTVSAELRYIDVATKQWLRAMKRICGRTVEVVSCPYGPTGAGANLANWRAETIYGMATPGPFVHAGGQRWSMRWEHAESR